MKHDKKSKTSSPAEGAFSFEIDGQTLNETITALGGAPLLARALRSLGVPGGVERHLHIKQRERSFDEAAYVESFLVLNGIGGDCLEDFDQVREDAGLTKLMGTRFPRPRRRASFSTSFTSVALMIAVFGALRKAIGSTPLVNAIVTPRTAGGQNAPRRNVACAIPLCTSKSKKSLIFSGFS